MNQAKLMTI